MASATTPFFGKILLFGEYSLMRGSAALVLPFSRNYVKLLFPDASLSASEARIARNSNKQLQAFMDYLHDQSGEIITGFSFERMKNDLANGLYLWSNIPSGYGLGSSGALVAAIYHLYGEGRLAGTAEKQAGDEIFPPEKLDALKITFARMEAFFHGASSGLDPLSSYVKKPLLVDYQQSISIVTQKLKSNSNNGGFFLLDTRMPRNTKPLVKAFHAKCQNASFLEMLNKEYIPLNNACINAVLHNDKNLHERMHRLSDLQLKHFKEMIPEAFLLPWAQGLSSGKYTLKLCGAGGGGFLLGYTDDYENVTQGMSNLEQNIIQLNDYL
jgi:mevalonate kinase